MSSQAFCPLNTGTVRLLQASRYGCWRRFAYGVMQFVHSKAADIFTSDLRGQVGRTAVRSRKCDSLSFEKRLSSFAIQQFEFRGVLKKLEFSREADVVRCTRLEGGWNSTEKDYSLFIRLTKKVNV